MRFWRVGRSYRGSLQSGAGRDAFVGLVPALSPQPGAPRMVPLPRTNAGGPKRDDPAQHLAAVNRALLDVETATGVKIALEAIEYVPDDAAHDDLLYSVAYGIASRLAAGGEFDSSR